MSSNTLCTIDAIVNTTHGDIKGAERIGIYGHSYYSFERIPFAKPPLGELRFKAPVPADPWTGVLDCTQPAQKPLQNTDYSTNQIEGTEDCLYLNAYVKKLNSPKPLPIMVFIHGGGFEKGDATRELYAPDYFMMKDVILITIAYRLGVLGFLSLEDPTLDVPGNAGLKDQLLGMQWVSENANNFNGDSQNITLFGESAGAASTHYLMLIPRARNLFQKAILMSGNIFCSWALPQTKNIPRRLARALGVEKELTDRELFEFLYSQSGEKLSEPYLLTLEEYLQDAIHAFGPVVEPYECTHCVLPKEPSLLVPKAWGNDIPIMLGGTSSEGLLMYKRVKVAPVLVTCLNDRPECMLPYYIRQIYGLNRQRQLGELIKYTHFGDKELTLNSLLEYCEYASYKVFWLGIWRTLEARLNYSSAPNYLYRFDFDSMTFNHQRIKYVGSKLRGVAHVDDRSYLFYGSYSWKLDQNTPEFETILRMIDIWTSFAATSDPNCNSIGVNDLGQTIWKPVKHQEQIKCLNISTNLEFIDLPEMTKLNVWRKL